MKYRSIFPVLLFFLNGCTHIVNKENDECQINWHYKEFEAKHYDVPIMMEAMPTHEDPELSQAGSIVSYVVPNNAETVMNYYNQEMERQGWDLICCVPGTIHTIATYQKPHQYCTLCLHQTAENTNIMLGVCQRV